MTLDTAGLTAGATMAMPRYSAPEVMVKEPVSSTMA